MATDLNAQGDAPLLMAHRYTLGMGPGGGHFTCGDCGRPGHPRNVGVVDRLDGPLCDECAERVACDLSDAAVVLNGLSEYLWHVLPEDAWVTVGDVLGDLLELVDHPTGEGEYAHDAVRHKVTRLTDRAPRVIPRVHSRVN